MRKAMFLRKFSAAHRLANDEGICSRIHGHNYRAEIFVSVERLFKGMVIHADRIKEVVDEKYDHRLIIDRHDPMLDLHFPGEWLVLLPFVPTTENLAAQISVDVADLVDTSQGHGYVFVKLYETDTIMALDRTEW